MHALDLDGKPLWKTRLSAYVNHQGFGSSPLLHQDLVIGVSDNKGGGAIVAMSQQTGEVIWKRDRPAKPNYPSPVVLNAAGREQLILTGCDLVTSLNPQTGATLWEAPGATTECVTTSVTDGQHVFTSGGYPKNHISAVLADGSGKLAWENNSRTYVPSMIVHQNSLFAVLDAGVAVCWDSTTGQELWKARLGGTFSSSLVLANQNIYAANEEGATFVYEASREKFRLLATNKLGDSVFSSPAICGGRIYQRIATSENGRRQEYAVCVGS
jgi:outer membrane protein assembly factor BamB